MHNHIMMQKNYIIWATLILFFAIFAFSYFQQQSRPKTKESYENGTTPITLIFKDIIMIDKARDSIEYDIQPKFNIRLNQDKAVQYIACADAKCSDANSFEITTTNDHEILLSSTQAAKVSQTNQFLQLKNVTETFDQFENCLLYTSDAADE